MDEIMTKTRADKKTSMNSLRVKKNKKMSKK